MLARARSLPAVTFRAEGRAMDGPVPVLTCGVRNGRCRGRAPPSRPGALAPGRPMPRGPSTDRRSEAAAAAMSALFSAAAGPVSPCGPTRTQTTREQHSGRAYAQLDRELSISGPGLYLPQVESGCNSNYNNNTWIFCFCLIVLLFFFFSASLLYSQFLHLGPAYPARPVKLLDSLLKLI